MRYEIEQILIKTAQSIFFIDYDTIINATFFF